MITINQILDKVTNIKTKFFIDIGASDSQPDSQTEILANMGWRGLMFECDIKKYMNLSSRMSSFDIKVISDKVSPDNILNYLSDNNVPDGFYLSLDIDGYDYYVLEKILSKYTPEIIISEINEKIPPPIKFSVLYNKNYWWNGTHYYGYSLSMIETLLNKYNYKIDHLYYNNVILIPGKQERDLLEVYEEGYLNKIDRNKYFHYNSDFEEIYKLQHSDQIEFINNKFNNYIGNFFIE